MTINLRLYTRDYGIFNYYDLHSYRLIWNGKKHIILADYTGNGDMKLISDDFDFHFQGFGTDSVVRTYLDGSEITQMENFIYFYARGSVEPSGRLAHHDMEGIIV